MPSTKQQAVPALLIGGLLVAPIFYIAMHHARPLVSASTTTSQSATDTISTLEQLVQSHPTAENRLNLSVAYINGDRPASAIPLLQTLVKEDPRNATAWNDLCVAHNMQSDFGHSIDECRTALSIDSGYQLAQNNLRWAQTQKQKTLDQIAAAEKLAPSSRTPESYLNEGMDQLHVGQYDQALATWQRLVLIDPHSAVAANNVGVAYMMMQRPSAAIPWFTKAYAMDPTLEIAKNNIAWAQSEQHLQTNQ